MRALILACIIALILPAGWCCTFPPAACDLQPVKVPTCRHCCRDADAAAPAKSSCPSREKAPLSCCGPREATIVVKTSHPEQPLLQATLCIELPALANCTAEAATTFEVPADGPPLHLLNCVWRC